MNIYKILPLFFTIILISCSPSQIKEDSNENFKRQIINNLKSQENFKIKSPDDIKVFLLRPYEITQYKNLIKSDLGEKTYNQIKNEIMLSEKFLLMIIKEDKYWQIDLNGIVAFNKNFYQSLQKGNLLHFKFKDRILVDMTKE